jgi:hypothetical protein
MKPVQRSEVMDLAAYEQVREHFRRRIIDLKRKRRVALGPNMTAVFENRDTALFQIQEMLRTERITREDAILHEIETYNDLVPGPAELSATIFVEYPDTAERDRMLVALDGLEKHFYLEVGGDRVAARSETRGIQPGRTTAVHYVKYPLGDAAAAALRGGGARVVLGVSHPAYEADAVLSADAVAELEADLTLD